MSALIEYDCSRSTAIQKLALNREKNELVVVYRENAAIYLYYGVPVALESIILADASLGQVVAEIRSLSSFRKIASWPKQTVSYHGHSNSFANNQGHYHNQPKTNPTPIAPPKSNMLIDALLNKARSRHNYSQEWKQVLESNVNELTLDQVEGLVLILKKCDPLQPPHKKPTIPADKHTTSTSTTNNNATDGRTSGFRSANVFAFAFDDDDSDLSDDDDDDDDEGTETVDGSIGPLSQTTSASASVVSSGLLAGLPIPPMHDRPGHSHNPSKRRGEPNSHDLSRLSLYHHQQQSSNTSREASLEAKEKTNTATTVSSTVAIQSRYLLMKLHCAMVDKMRALANAAQREKNYVMMTTWWVDVYELTNGCLLQTDGWFASTLQIQIPAASSSSSYTGDDHNRHDLATLQELMDSAGVLADDSQREKNLAVSYLHQRLKYLTEKLNPLWTARDEAKGRIGEEKWTTNPAPKRNHAEQRRELERDHREVSKALELLESLQLMGQPRSDHH